MDYSNALRGKVAIVTGAGRGIGRAIAIAYAKAGASVGCAARTLAELNDTVTEIEANNAPGLAVQTDVSQFAAVEHLVKATVDAFGRLDILVINAGVNFDRNTVEDSVPEDWQATFAVNLTGAYYCAKAAIPFLKESGAGKIITVGSGMGHRGTKASSAYSCSKAGLWMLTRILAQELWPDNISVNELIPGPVETSMTAGSSDRRESVFGIDSEWKKGPQDVVPLALFLATQPPVGPSAQSFSLMRRDN